MSIVGESFAEWKQRIFFDHGFLREIYPNISFGKNFVSLSIFLEDKKISCKEKDFSKDIDKFYLED